MTAAIPSPGTLARALAEDISATSVLVKIAFAPPVSSYSACALDEELREQADALQLRKQQLFVEREQVRQELAACEQGSIDAARIRAALVKFGELLPTLRQNEQRDLILLFLEPVEIRPAGRDAKKLSAASRLLDLRLKLRVGRLVEGMSERLVIEERTARAASAPPGRPLPIAPTMAAPSRPIIVS